MPWSNREPAAHPSWTTVRPTTPTNRRPATTPRRLDIRASPVYNPAMVSGPDAGGVETAHASPSLRAIARPVRLVVAGLLLCGFAAPASARAIVKVMPASVATGFPLNGSYQLSLLDLAAGAEIGDKFALAGGLKAMEYFGWWYGWNAAVPLPVFGYLLMPSEEADYNNRVVPYVVLGAYPTAIPKYNAVAGTAGLGVGWNFYAVTAGAEFRTVVWHTRYETSTMYILQFTFGLGGWYALGQGEGSGSWLNQ